jgi:non-specific serine/threonine protein kinase
MVQIPRPRTSFIGREHELQELSALLYDGGLRLITLTGPGGIGKTRLAVEIVHALDQLTPDRTSVFVDLTVLQEPTGFEYRLAEALGVTEIGASRLDEVLGRALNRVDVLVLDNCEHVLGAASRLAPLLEAAPHVKILSTSREAWHLNGEQEYPLRPLGVPERSSANSPCQAAAYPAVALFVARARALDPGFALDHANFCDIVELVHRLDGLPLAVELAAARSKLLPPRALLGRLSTRLAVLQASALDIPARHRTLAAAIDWSVELLSEPEARLFRRLAVFSGGWTIDAAHTVCTFEEGDNGDDTLALLGSLLDKSLIVRDCSQPGEPRFSMLQTIRAYAEERLQRSGELEIQRGRHADYFLRFAQLAGQRFLGSADGALVQAVEADHANLQTALRWCIASGDNSTGLRLGAALWPYWFGQGHLAEGRRLLEQLLEIDRSSSPTRERARVLAGLAALILRQEDVVIGRNRAEEALRDAEATSDAGCKAQALFEMGWVARVTNAAEDAATLFEQSRTAALASGERFWEAASVEHLGLLALHQGDLARGHALLESAVDLHRAAAHTWGLAGGLVALGTLRTAQAALDSARTALREAATIYQDLSDVLGQANCIDALGLLHASTHAPVTAARLFAAAERAREQVGIAASWSLDPNRVATAEALRGALGERAYTEAWATGRELNVDQALAEGFDENATCADTNTVDEIRLTSREKEVAALIPLGLSNREIAERLIIGERTVESHVSHLLAKLGLPSRTRLASWVTEAGLDSAPEPEPVRIPQSDRISVLKTVPARTPLRLARA